MVNSLVAFTRILLRYPILVEWLNRMQHLFLFFLGGDLTQKDCYPGEEKMVE